MCYDPDSKLIHGQSVGRSEQGHVGSLLKEISAIQRALARNIPCRSRTGRESRQLLLGSEASFWDSAQVNTKREKTWAWTLADDLSQGDLTYRRQTPSSFPTLKGAKAVGNNT